MIKICHMTSAHTAFDTRIFYKECASLARAGYDVNLIARGESFVKDGVHILGAGEPPSSRFKRMTGYAKKVYKLALSVDADIYHFHDPELLPYGLKLKKRGKKVIFDSHEDTLNQMNDKPWIPKSVRPFVSRIYKSYAKSAFSYFDALIAVTPHVVTDLKKYNLLTRMITNYPILTYPHENVTKAPNHFTICFTGGLSEQWSHEFIVNAVMDIDDVYYTLCGNGEEQYISGLKKLPGFKKVNYLGKVTHEKALEIQARANVGMTILQPSNNSGGSLGTIGNTKLFEYMMTGIPVICTNFTLWKQIIDKYQCGLCVCPSDVKAIEKAIRYIKDNPIEAQQMGENGRKAVEQEFNWGMQEKELLKLYEMLSV